MRMASPTLFQRNANPRQRLGRGLLTAVALAMVSLGTASCSENQPAEVAVESPAPSQETKPMFRQKALPEQRGKKKFPGPPAFNEKGPAAPLVGGCGDLCGSARGGFEGFIRALLATKAPKDVPFIRFVDTSILVDNNQALGADWARLFLENKLPERQGSIDAWIERYKARTGHATDAEALEAALGSTSDLTRISSTQVRFTFAPPPRDQAQTGSLWSIVVTRRGLEWLVSDITDAP